MCASAISIILYLSSSYYYIYVFETVGLDDANFVGLFLSLTSNDHWTVSYEVGNVMWIEIQDGLQT